VFLRSAGASTLPTLSSSCGPDELIGLSRTEWNVSEEIDLTLFDDLDSALNDPTSEKSPTGVLPSKIK